ncbi:hypothetical protein PCASD_22902 [Puccinia coronata f. sp. avenae]|uniref:Uncharacterized protein n=1 Tax=Puccinia coronata f. sp. avenae TaxID=200324 RepID=A0A2N5U2Z3_9BASI|nr:hypothetical protein PCASD_22902 [Puccinia coronata f. sp. avenae]
MLAVDSDNAATHATLSSKSAKNSVQRAWRREKLHCFNKCTNTASKSGLDGRIQVNSGYGHPI